MFSEPSLLSPVSLYEFNRSVQIPVPLLPIASLPSLPPPASPPPLHFQNEDSWDPLPPACPMAPVEPWVCLSAVA